MGIIPDLLTNPTVGLIPTIPLTAEGQTTEPSVQLPTIQRKDLQLRPPEPALEPHGL
jgi:hypothetical protein